uniref:Uncharacterized protein n=1 Tax=Leptobrachium leishanense TaxID=445787 RepID=A0A8C5QP13_9ANUR
MPASKPLKKTRPPDPSVAQHFVPAKKQAEAFQDGGHGETLYPEDELSTSADLAAPASRGDVERLFIKMSQMQTFLAGEVAKLGTELRGEIDSLGARTAELEDQAAEITQAHNDLAEGTGDLAKRVSFLESKMEDLSNRSRRNNIRLRGLPETVSPKDLNGTVLGILRRLAPDIPEAQLLMDRIHRAQRPPNISSLIPRDVIFRMHYFTAKHQILHAARTFQLDFEDKPLQLFQDLDPATLRRRRAWRPITEHLSANDIPYTWGFPFRLQVSVAGRQVALTPSSELAAFWAAVKCPPLEDFVAPGLPPSSFPRLQQRWTRVGITSGDG